MLALRWSLFGLVVLLAAGAVASGILGKRVLAVSVVPAVTTIQEGQLVDLVITVRNRGMLPLSLIRWERHWEQNLLIESQDLLIIPSQGAQDQPVVERLWPFDAATFTARAYFTPEAAANREHGRIGFRECAGLAEAGRRYLPAVVWSEPVVMTVTQ